MIKVYYWVGKEKTDNGFAEEEGDTSVTIKMSSFRQNSIVAYAHYEENDTDNTLILDLNVKEKHIPNNIFYSDTSLNGSKVQKRQYEIDNPGDYRFAFNLELNEDEAEIDVFFDKDDNGDKAEVYLVPSSPYI